eukprot:3280011-Lingulodinium_polyedra.AAC.1
MLELRASRTCRLTSSRFGAGAPAFQVMKEEHELSSVGLRLSGLWTRVPKWKFTGGGTPSGLCILALRSGSRYKRWLVRHT